MAPALPVQKQEQRPRGGSGSSLWGPWPSPCLSPGSVSCQIRGWGDEPDISGFLPRALPFQASSKNRESCVLAAGKTKSPGVQPGHPPGAPGTMFPSLNVGLCVELLPLEAHPISPTRGSEAGTWGLSSTHQQLLGPITSTLILSPASSLHQPPAEGQGEIQRWACDTPHQGQWGGAQGARWHSLSTHYLPGTCAESSRDPMSLTKLLWRLEPHSLPAAQPRACAPDPQAILPLWQLPHALPQPWLGAACGLSENLPNSRGRP